MSDISVLRDLCEQELHRRGCADNYEYQNRLALELKAVDEQADFEYFLELMEKKAYFAENENNLLIAELLNLAPAADLSRDPSYAMGEFPDIDTDYLKLVREYLKNEWAAKTFGQENICSIGTYGTLHIKQALKDMARVFGLPRAEVEAVTKKIPTKDDEYKPIQWDKAMELVPELKDYCEAHPDVADAVTTLLDRNKSGGVHAGGLIISSKPIADFVPLEVRSVSKDNKYGVICSAWGEGQRTQDLSPVGLVKFDLLGIENLHQIAICSKLIRERHGIEKISALPGQGNWSDTSYLNDPKALDMADKGDLKCIFQFNDDKMQRMVKEGGVTSFHDLPAYSALHRPGPINMKMPERYCKRKRGLEKYTLHPLLRPILGYTYGVMTYQEQVMQILNIVGHIPLIHCETVRKAISKKKLNEFARYKEAFVTNGQKTLSASQEYVEYLWSQIEAFADYGFNKSMGVDTLIPSPCGDGAWVNRKIQDFRPGDRVLGVSESGAVVEVDVVAIHDHGVLDGYKITFDDGSSEVCTINHKFLTIRGQKSLEDILETNLSILSVREVDLAMATSTESVSHDIAHGVSHLNLPATPGHAAIDNAKLVFRRIAQVTPIGKQQMYDLEVAHPTHNFLLGNGVVTSNSHSYAYSYVSARQLYLKAHYPLEFYCAALRVEAENDKFKEIKLDAKQHGIDILPVDINKSKEVFTITSDNTIHYGFLNLKEVGEKVSQSIVSGQPYTGFPDFLHRSGADGTSVKALVSLGSFDEGMDRLSLFKFYHHVRASRTSFHARIKNHAKALDRYDAQLRDIIDTYKPSDIRSDSLYSFNDDSIKLWHKLFSHIDVDETYNSKGQVKTRTVSVFKLLDRIRAKRERSIENFASGEDEPPMPDLEGFDPRRVRLNLSPAVESLFVGDTKHAEATYYGFLWTHYLEESPDYTGRTISKILYEAEHDQLSMGTIEVEVENVVHKTTKRGFAMHNINVEDANGVKAVVVMWDDDWERFSKDLYGRTIENGVYRHGALVSMQVKPPDSGWNSFTFNSPKRHERWKLPKNKDDDIRLLKLRPGAPVSTLKKPLEEVEESWSIID